MNEIDEVNLPLFQEKSTTKIQYLNNKTILTFLVDEIGVVAGDQVRVEMLGLQDFKIGEVIGYHRGTDSGGSVVVSLEQASRFKS